MEKVSTKYGILQGVAHINYYPDGQLKECFLVEANEIKTEYGLLVPQYQDDGLRRKQIKPLTFHENGNLKNVPLAEQTQIITPCGVIPTEQITFYANGCIRRVFPLDGKLSGFWSEEDEYTLAREFQFNFAFGQLQQKVISINFYEQGVMKSLTFWPKDTAVVHTPVGEIETRIGLSLYPSGALKSIEPNKPIAVETPIGKISAFNLKALGIHGDSNSLKFSPAGQIESVITSTEVVEVTKSTGEKQIIQPRIKPSMFNLKVMERIPTKISFQGTKVCFNDSRKLVFDRHECTFTIKPYLRQQEQACSDCAGCSACG